MIGRRSVIAVAEAYQTHFYITYRHSDGSPSTKLNKEGLYDFLFAENFDAWIMNKFRDLSIFDKRGLKEFIMRIHTSESLLSATPNWSSDQRLALGQRILKDLAESLIRLRYEDPEFGSYRTRDIRAVNAMQTALELDGYVYKEKILWVPEESVIEVREEEGVLMNLIRSVGLQDPQTLNHHLELSASHYQESRWDDSISNSRKVLEGVLQQTAIRYAGILKHPPLSSSILAKAYAIREYLEKKGLLEKKERETLAQVYGLLSDTGGHPFIAQKDQARLMRHLSLTFCQFILLRLDGVSKQLAK